MRIVNLGSGSKGNSTFVQYKGTRILVDAGFSQKKLSEKLASIGEKVEDINAVIVTHEHIDHIKGIKTLAKKYDIDFYIEEELVTSGAIQIDFKSNKLHKIGVLPFSVGDIEIKPFKISHDAVCPVGYTINANSSKSKIAFLTDLGIVEKSVFEEICGAKMIFIESNYDENMLESGFYPEEVKRRIAGEYGHLSNSQSLELAKKLYETGTKCFILSHISENNNTMELAYLNYVDYFEKQGLILDKDVFIRLSYQNKPTADFILKENFDEQ